MIFLSQVKIWGKKLDKIEDSGGSEARRRKLPEGGEVDSFVSHDGTRIRYGVWQNSTPVGGKPPATVFLLPGRTEFIEKYSEMIAELLDRNYAVVVMDWRNQGLSDRPLANRSKHYCVDFAPAVDDLGALLEHLSGAGLPETKYLLAHSFGGHLSLRFMHDNPGVFTRAVFSAPMVDIRYAPMPKWFARALVRANIALGRAKSYAPLQGDYGEWARGKMNMVLLTHDPERFWDEHFLIEQNPDLALGGITYGWLQAAARSIDLINAPGYPEAIEARVLVIQAGADRIINNITQAAFAGRLPNGQLKVIEGSRHEMMKEVDEFRLAFWRTFDDFMAE